MSITSYATALTEFLQSNPTSTVTEFSEPSSCVGIKNLWGDESIAIELNDDNIINALNNVVLPERYTAIWHKNTNRFEIIFTAYELNEVYSSLPGRHFSFVYQNKEYACKFDKSSSELLTIASHFFTVGPITLSLHRNLGSFKKYSKLLEEGRSPGKAIPISFWIDGLHWDENVVLRLVSHLNFYMAYYDAASPLIAVHSPKAENIARQPQPRYLFEIFPNNIKAREIDDNILKYWEASRIGDPIRRFIYCYQIIEYAAVSAVEENIRKSIKKILLNPICADATNESTQRIIECVGESKLHDSQKIDNLIRESVDPLLIWREIENNISFYSKPIIFDGGFSLDPIARSGWNFDDFKVSGLTAVSSALRRIFICAKTHQKCAITRQRPKNNASYRAYHR
jgi:hypothetical protein